MLLLLILSCAPQHSFEIPGASHWDGMGMSTFILDDITGDGIAEIGSSAFCTDYNGTNSGSVYIFDGSTFDQIRRHDGVGPSSRLGRFCTILSDIDGDSIREYAASAPYESTHASLAGAVYVWSGATGQRLAWLSGQEFHGNLGASIASISDLDGDGVGDILVGAPGEGNGDGRVYAFSGANGDEIGRFEGRSSNGGCGTSIDAIGDIDNDGVEDFAAGEPYARSGKGDVHLISGSNFSRIRRIRNYTPNSWFGFRLANVGDTNGDGYDEILIGEPCDDTVHLYKKNGNRIRKHVGIGDNGGPKQGWGHSVAAAGDINGDGLADYVVGSPGEWAGFSFVNPGLETIIFSGSNGSQLLTVVPTEGDDSFGSSVTVGVAIPSTGQLGLLIGAPAAGSISGQHAQGLVCGLLLP